MSLQPTSGRAASSHDGEIQLHPHMLCGGDETSCRELMIFHNGQKVPNVQALGPACSIDRQPPSTALESPLSAQSAAVETDVAKHGAVFHCDHAESTVVEPRRRRKRTFDEISQELGPDHWIWREGWSCEKGCSCWFCELWLGEIIDDCLVSNHQSNAPEVVTERD